MSDRNKAVLNEANEAISRGDYEGFLSHCTDDTEWTFVGDMTLRGKDAVRQWMAATYKEPPVFEVAYLIAEGDYVAALGAITLQDEAGKAAVSSYCDVWRFRGAKLAALQAFVIVT